nr:MAG TPA: hypothetical protein [Caudoviricetes sp.]
MVRVYSLSLPPLNNVRMMSITINNDKIHINKAMYNTSFT